MELLDAVVLDQWTTHAAGESWEGALRARETKGAYDLRARSPPILSLLPSLPLSPPIVDSRDYTERVITIER